MRGGARFVLGLAMLAAALAVGTIATSGAVAADKVSKLHAPTLLWKTYPLVQRARVPTFRTNASDRREASAPSSGQSQTLAHMFLLTALLATFLASATVLFMRRPTTARAGGGVRGRNGARTPRPARRPQPRRRRATAKAPPPPPAPPTEPVAEPGAAPAREDESAGEPLDDLQRALDDLLEPLRPAGPARPDEARIPELELRELIMRRYAAPASDRPSIDQEIDAALQRIEERRVAEGRARAARRTTLARCETKLWRGFVRSQLYAVMAGSEDAFAVSESFRLRDPDQPTPQAKHALAMLLAGLEQAGWTVVAYGRAWYERILELRPPDSTVDEADTAERDEHDPPSVIYRSVPRNGTAEQAGD